MNNQEIEKAISLLKSDIGVLDNYLKKHPLVISHYLEKDRCIENQLIKDMEFTISALKHQLTNGWIPVTERLPNMEECQKNDCRFIVTDGNRVYEDSFDYMADGYIEPHWTYSTMCQPTAWRQLPEPYKEVSE